MRAIDRLYRAFLRLYPAEFRGEYGREMAQLFRDRSRLEPPLRLGLDVVADLVTTVPREHARSFSSDLRYALRAIRRTPVFSLTVSTTIALAVAANTSMFSVVNAVLLRPLPFAEPDRLMQVAEKNDRLNLSNFGASALNFVSWRERTRAFQQLAGLGPASFSLSGVGEPEQFIGARVSPALMSVLGIAPVAGRGFVDAEEEPGSAAVAMLGERAWARRFGRDPSILGRTLTLNGVPTTVIGIAPASLSLFSNGEIYVPLTIDPTKENRLNHVIIVVGRLKRGVTMAEAQAECDTIAIGLARVYPEMRDWGVHVLTFFETFVTPQLEAGILMLFVAVGFVLLIACANITNLLLARATARRKEMAIRTALGASRGRLLRQLLVESVTLASLGGGLGVLATVSLVRGINAALPPAVLPVSDVRIDGSVLAFGLALTVATGFLFGMAPAASASRDGLAEILRTARGAAAGRVRLRHGLAAVEIALATVLLIGAGLLGQTFLNLQRARLGFDPQRLLTFQLAPPTLKYSLSDKAPQLYRALLDSLQTVPGVRSAAVSSGIPFGQGNYTTSPLVSTGPSALPPDTSVPIDWRIVSPAYFETMTIPLLRGRDFSDADGASGPPVTIVSQATARKFWGESDPIGRTLRRTADGRTFTVVGVVGDVRSTTLNQESPAVYYSLAARVWPLMDVVIRTDVPPATLLPMVRQKVHALDAELPLATVRTMDEWVASSAAQPRLSAVLVGAFAAVAVVVAAIGIYGVLAYSVNQRRREIGVRIALGARVDEVVGLVVREGMTVAGAGVGAGVAGAMILSRAIGHLIYGVAPRDPRTVVAVAVLLGLVSLLACWLPARRAARISPTVTLRDE